MDLTISLPSKKAKVARDRLFHPSGQPEKHGDGGNLRGNPMCPNHASKLERSGTKPEELPGCADVPGVSVTALDPTGGVPVRVKSRLSPGEGGKASSEWFAVPDF